MSTYLSRRSTRGYHPELGGVCGRYRAKQVVNAAAAAAVIAFAPGTDPGAMTNEQNAVAVEVDQPAGTRPAVRCHARRTNGEPCGNYAMHGSRVCHAHGGRAPAVRQAAERRMLEANLARQVDRHLAEAEAMRRAMKPWMDELGPRPLWAWHPPDLLRRIAAEMRRTAGELSVLAEQNKLGY